MRSVGEVGGSRRVALIAGVAAHQPGVGGGSASTSHRGGDSSADRDKCREFQLKKKGLQFAPERADEVSAPWQLTRVPL